MQWPRHHQHIKELFSLSFKFRSHQLVPLALPCHHYNMPTEQPTVPPDGAVLFISLGCYLRNDCTNALHPSDRVAFCVRSQECSPNIKMNHNHGVATALLGLIRTIIFFHFDDSQFLAFWKHHTIDAFTLFTHGRE